MPESLIDKDFVTSRLTVGDPWSKSHGSGEDSEDLGAGMLYYSLAYSLKAKTCVCLGSGGGFVPRLMRQAQRDLELVDSRTFLVDRGEKEIPQDKQIWGTPDWIEEGSLFRQNYPDVEIVLELTQVAYERLFKAQGIQIDFLHVDADHHYDGVQRDFEMYSSLVPEEGVITLHDTTNFREPCGVPSLLEEIRDQGEFAVINFPIAYGTAILKRNP